MALKINVELSQLGGGVIPSGAILRYGVTSRPNNLYFQFFIDTYRSQLDMDNNEQPVYSKVIDTTYQIPLDTALVANPSITQASDIGGLLDLLLKERIESIPEIGVGNTEIV